VRSADSTPAWREHAPRSFRRIDAVFVATALLRATGFPLENGCSPGARGVGRCAVVTERAAADAEGANEGTQERGNELRISMKGFCLQGWRCWRGSWGRFRKRTGLPQRVFSWQNARHELLAPTALRRGRTTFLATRPDGVQSRIAFERETSRFRAPHDSRDSLLEDVRFRERIQCSSC